MVCGDTREEMEMAALDQAREFFGPDARLRVIPEYSVVRNRDTSPGGKKWIASPGITVYELLERDDPA
jgi:hypothetical protein